MTTDALGLRERKKRETRRALHRAAVLLADELGYTEVTTEAIAARAGVSPRTFFNYFPTKQDAIIGAEPADLDAAVDLIVNAPDGGALLETVWEAVLLVLVPAHSDAELRRRRRSLMFSEPALAGTVFASTISIEDRLVEAVETRLGLKAGAQLRPRQLVVTVMGAVRSAMRVTQGEIHSRRFATALDEAYATLVHGLV